MKILWRISIKEENNKNLVTCFSNKFGYDIEKKNGQFDIDCVNKMFNEIKNMGIKLGGIHFHCGSGDDGSGNFTKALDFAQNCMEIGRKHNHRMEMLDIGGGFPAGNIPESLVKELERTKNNSLGYEVIAEPGRYFSTKSCLLANRIIGKRYKNNQICYHINDSLYHSYNCMLMDGVSFENDSNQFYSHWNSDSKKTYDMQPDKYKPGTIFGMTCDGLDIVVRNINMPEMEIGDWMVLGGMGAYTVGPTSNFNGMKVLEKIVIWKEKDMESQEVKEKQVVKNESKKFKKNNEIVI